MNIAHARLQSGEHLVAAPFEGARCGAAHEAVAVGEAPRELRHGAHHHVDAVAVPPVARAVRQRLHLGSRALRAAEIA